MRRLGCVVSLLIILFVVSNSSAQQTSITTVPNLIRYSGTLSQSGSLAASPKIAGVTFAIYKQQEGGAPVWMETQNITLDAGGHYSVLLGSTRAEGLPADLFSAQEERWLGVQVQGQPEQPRGLLVSVPYAMKAAEADRLAGHSASEFVTTESLQSAMQEQLQQSPVVSISPSGSQSAKNANSGGPLATTNPATNFVDTTTDQVVVVQQNGTGMGLIASSPSDVGVLGTTNSSPTANVVAGVEGVSSLAGSYGVFGHAKSTSSSNPGFGVYGRSDSPNGIGVEGIALGTGSTIGLIGQASSTSGFAIDATETATSGNTAGMVAQIWSPAGIGALIKNNASGTITGKLISVRTNVGEVFNVDAVGSIHTQGGFRGVGNVTANQLNSTVATGTAPFTVTSTTQVANLNASLLGGNPASGFIWNNTVQTNASFVIDGSGTLGGALSAKTVNTGTSFEIGGGTVVSVGSSGDKNLFLGIGAGSNNQPLLGLRNTFSGYQAGFSNTTGSNNAFYGNWAGYYNTTGDGNTFSGSFAGYYNTIGFYNTFSGAGAGSANIAGHDNAFYGNEAGHANTSGVRNTFSGSEAGSANTTGKDNTFYGYRAGYSNTTGDGNTLYGSGAGGNSGDFNTSFGYQAGYNSQGHDNIFNGYRAGYYSLTGSSNIYLGNQGYSESNTIRIGTQGTGNGQQNVTYIAGILGATTNSGVPVFVDATGKLGTVGGSLGGVTSFNGRSGAVVPATNDYSFSQISGTLGSSQLSGTYANALTLNNPSNSFTGSFVGNGVGLTGVFPAAGSPNYIQNGAVQQAGANFNIDGNGTLGGTVSAGLVNVSGSYQIGGKTVVSTFGTENLFLGALAGFSNPSGSANTFAGYAAGYTNATGIANSFYGWESGQSNLDGSRNTFYGYSAGGDNISGGDNTFSGFEAGLSNTLGDDNSFFGFQAGRNNTSGSLNTYAGYQAGQNTTGSYNSFYGQQAGINNPTGNSNIYVGNVGIGAENNIIRIGTPGTSNAQQNATYIAGIFGSSVGGSGIAVYVDSNGQLGTAVSSRRFKEQIRDMGDSTDALMKLRPVTFLYKPEYDKGRRSLQYGLIAEEVAEVYPELVAYGKDGKPYTVKYQYLTTMLLNEMQRQYHRAEAEATVITAQQQKIDELEHRLSRLESMMGTQVNTSVGKTPTTTVNAGGGSQ